jgi:hypothetical protein
MGASPRRRTLWQSLLRARTASLASKATSRASQVPRVSSRACCVASPNFTTIVSPGRAHYWLPCVCRGLSEDEDRDMEGPIQLHLGPAQPAAAPLQEGDSRELVRGWCRDRADARGRVGGEHVGPRAKTAPSEVGRCGVARVSARSCVCEHLWHLCVVRCGADEWDQRLGRGPETAIGCESSVS